MKKLVMVLAMLAGIAMSAQAQKHLGLPVAPENDIVSNLFVVPDSEANYHFMIELGESNYLLIDFRYPWYWSGKDSGSFRDVIRTAAAMEGKYRGMMLNSQSSKRLDINIPVKKEPVTVRFTEHTENANMQVFTANDNAPLKIGMDTIRVMKTYFVWELPMETRSKVSFVVPRNNDEVQYTFLLKDINQIQELAANEEWIKNASGVLDSVVKSYVKKSKHSNSWSYPVYVFAKKTVNDSLKVTRADYLGRKKSFSLGYLSDVGVGVSLVRNSLAPDLEIGIRFKHRIDNSIYFVQRFSWSNFYLYNKQANNTFKGYVTSMVNYEIGFGSKDKILGDIGFGVRIFGTTSAFQDDPSVTRDLYKLFFNTSLSRTISLSPELYFVPKHNDQNWAGISLIVHFL